MPLELRGDPGRLRQVVNNLVGNAVKFTAQGEVVVTVSRASETPTHARLRFEVRDTGIGIDEKGQQRLFKAFSQADGSTTRKYGGTGLGLAISKKLVELMTGQIGVTSEMGKGSVFAFEAEFEKQTIALKSVVHQDLSGLHVLVVDDNATNREILDHHTRMWKMRSALAESGEQALAMLREQANKDPFELAILDMQMPEMDGLMLGEQIKGDPAIASTRLIMLTSLGNQMDAEAMKKGGIEACVLKPVKQSRLFNRIAEVMAGHRPLTRKKTQTATLTMKGVISAPGPDQEAHAHFAGISINQEGRGRPAQQHRLRRRRGQQRPRGARRAGSAPLRFDFDGLSRCRSSTATRPRRASAAAPT